MNAQGKVIATDLDGTLFYPKRRFRMINTKNKRFLRRFIDSGGRVLLVSGRNVTSLLEVERRLKRKVDFAGCNGAFLRVNNQYIRKIYLDNKKISTVIEEIDNRFHLEGYFIMSEEYNVVVPKQEFGLFNRFGYFCYQMWQGIYKEKTVQDDKILHDSLKHAKIFKIMLFFGIGKKNMLRCKKAYEQLIKLYPEYDFAYNGPSIEVTDFRANKAKAVKQYLDYLKIKHDNVMVVGDSGNDLSMFHYFPNNSFCMAQASSEISRYAKYKIRTVSELEKYL